MIIYVDISNNSGTHATPLSLTFFYSLLILLVVVHNHYIRLIKWMTKHETHVLIDKLGAVLIE